jgi:hypothetical protein
MSAMDKLIGLSASYDGCHVIGAREARAQIINECQTEHDYHTAVTKLYADPHIRLTTEADIKKAEMVDYREHMAQRFADTSLTRQQVDTLKNLALPEGLLVKDLVLALFALEQQMHFVIERQKAKVPQELEPPQSHTACGCFVIDTEECMDTEGLHLTQSFTRMPMVSDDYVGFFEVDIYEHAVTLRHLDVAQQVEVMCHVMGRPSPNKGTESYTFDFDKEEPSTGLFVCLSEGLCAWNRQEERYDLVFPISALRSLFGWCQEQFSEKKMEDC